METDALGQKTRIEWDKYESVLLLDAVISVYENGKNRKTVISDLSSFLRKRAILNGLQIDSIFRNENGIRMKFDQIKFYFYNDQTGMTGSSKTFKEVCELYKNSRDEYYQLLNTAKQLPESSEKLQNKFFNWLHLNVGNKLEDINNGFLILNEFCKEQKAFHKSFYSLCSEDEIVSLVNLLQDDKGMVSHIKKNKIDIVNCIRYFVKYLKVEKKICAENFYVRSDDILKTKEDSGKSLTSQIQFDIQDKNNFFEWMISIGMALATSKNYCYQLVQINQYILSKGYCEKAVNQLTVMELKKVLSQLNQDKIFLERNSTQHNALSAAFAKYIKYREADNENLINLTSNYNKLNPSILSNEQKENCEKVLEKEFSNGMNYKSIIHINKFKIFYNEYMGEELLIDNEIFIKQLEQLGIIIEQKLYPAKKFTHNSLLISIEKEILEILASGVSCVFAECIYHKYRQQLDQELQIYNFNMLITILCYIHPQLIVKKDCFCSSYYADYAIDILNLYKSEYVPLSYQTVHEKLWYIPLDKIKKIFACNRFKELVNVDTETFFYAPHISLSGNELQQITREMDKVILQKNYIVAKDFPEILAKADSSLPFKFEGYKDWAVREILKYFLSDKFSFNSIVSEKDKPLDNGKVFKAFCEDKIQCSLEELKRFADELGTIIYWNDVFSVMIRVEKNLLINKKYFTFDTKAFDEEIGKQCLGDYIPLRKISLYEHFPVTYHYKCNGFLLESYLLNYSEKYRLLNSSLAAKGYYGIVVKKSSPFTSYSDVIIDLLAHSSQDWTNIPSALELLVQEGCQARRTLEGIEQIVEEAKRRREEIANKDKY